MEYAGYSVTNKFNLNLSEIVETNENEVNISTPLQWKQINNLLELGYFLNKQGIISSLLSSFFLPVGICIK